MRFDYLHECRDYIVNYAKRCGATITDFDLAPMSYGSEQRLTGEHSVEVTDLKGKSTRSRLQIILERFETGRYEVICYVS